MSDGQISTSVRDDDLAVIRLTGEFDLATSDRLRDALLGQLDHGHPRNLVLDMSEVTFLDSTGLGVFMAAQQLAKRNEVQFVLAGSSERVRRLLEITQLDGVLAMQPTVEEALTLFAAEPNR
jgi:anti-sigma B factor antagonist